MFKLRFSVTKDCSILRDQRNLTAPTITPFLNMKILRGNFLLRKYNIYFVILIVTLHNFIKLEMDFKLFNNSFNYN